MQSYLNTKLFEELVQYVGNAHKDFSLDQSSPTARRKHQEVPTAALVTGINTPDHDVTFSNLMSMVRDHVTSYIAVLKSKDCPNLRSIMTTTVAQIMDSADMMDDDEEEVVTTTTSHRISGSMAVLKSWYQEVSKVKPLSPRKRRADGSPRKTPGSRGPRSPVVIVLEDLESFPPSVLQDFITVCSHHLNDIPLVFIFGIATSVTAVHRLLPQRVSSLLCMEKFQAPPSSDCLAQVIQQVVMAPEFPFKLGGRVFHTLVDMFLYHDFSVLKFIQGFQFALLDHFYNNPASVMCVSLGDLDAQVKNLSSRQLDQLRSVPSFRRHVEKKPANQQIELLEDDEVTKTVVLEFVEALYDYNRCVLPVVMCLHCFVHRLPGQPLGHKLREIYGTILNHNICDTPQYTESIVLLKALSRDEIALKLGQCVDFLSDETCPEALSEIKTKLSEFKDKFENIEQLMQQQESSEGGDEEPEMLSPGRRVSSVGKMDLAQLKQTLQDMDKKKKKLTLYEITRRDAIDYLDTVFRRYLVSPTVLPLHEVMYCGRSAAIKSQINGMPRSNLENGLSNPYYYLQNDDLKSDGLTILPSLPDVCIVYKLHKECGRLINLYDWLQAFVMIVNAGAENDENKLAQQKPDEFLQARFIRAVSELQFLGYIKPTQRKTDHVARLTWGAC